MLSIKGRNIQITRGDVLPITISANSEIDGSAYKFQIDDIIRFKIMQKDRVETVLLSKDFKITEVGTEQQITIPANDMKIGELKSKPIDYWYEIELNPDTEKTNTIEGYDKEDGPAIITILPEGGDIE